MTDIEKMEAAFLDRVRVGWRIEPGDLATDDVADLFEYLSRRAAVENDDVKTDQLILRRITWAIAAGAATALSMAIGEAGGRPGALIGFAVLAEDRTRDPDLVDRVIEQAADIAAQRDAAAEDVDVPAMLGRLSEITTQLTGGAEGAADREALQDEALKLLAQIVGAR